MNYFKENILSVSELNEFVKMLFDSTVELSNVRIRGEISNFTAHRSGHFYFSLKDERSVLKAVMFAGDNAKLKFKPESGMKVVAHGRITSFPRDGIYQIYVTNIEPDGLGALYLAYEQLKNKLEKEGLFDAKYKKPLPKYPSCIGVVTSATGAVINDIINVSKRRYPSAKILLFPALVQGATAAKTLIDGLNYFDSSGVADVIIIGRGGGSLEDLWAFNDEALARTIVKVKTPIISAVGHETDFTICDFVSSVRAPTPSAAAEIALPSQDELRQKLQVYYEKLGSKTANYLSFSREKVENFSGKFRVKLLSAFFEKRRAELKLLAKNLDTGIDSALISSKNSLSVLAEKLDALSPLSVLSRGYTIAKDESGKPLLSVEQIEKGDSFTVQLLDGEIRAVANEIVKKQKIDRDF